MLSHFIFNYHYVNREKINLRSENNPIAKQIQWINARVIYRNQYLEYRHLGKKKRQFHLYKELNLIMSDLCLDQFQ